MSYTSADPERSFPRARAAVVANDHNLSRLGRTIEVRPDTVWPWIVEIMANGQNGDKKLLTLRELAYRTSADVSDFANLCQKLNGAGYIWLAPPDGAVTLDEFLFEFRWWVRHWIRRMFDHPVWDEVRTGEASPAVLVGWVKENMHYTGSVIRHMTRAAAFAENSAEGWTLLVHNSQEWDHYALFRDACASVGIPRDALESARKLRSTAGITHLMRRIARRHPLVYNACEAMLEATAEDPARVVTFFESVRDRYDYPRSLIDPLIEHLHVDEDFQHIDIFDGLVQHMTVVPFTLLADIMNSCQELADMMHIWHAEIAQHYSRVSSPQEILSASTRR